MSIGAEQARLYEIAYLLVEATGETEVEKVIIGGKAEVKNTRALVHIKLAYPIAHQTHAYFGAREAEIMPANVKGIMDTLKVLPGVLRVLIVEVQKKSPRAKIEKPRREELRPKAAIPESQEALSNEALEEKLEEILK